MKSDLDSYYFAIAGEPSRTEFQTNLGLLKSKERALLQIVKREGEVSHDM